MKKLLLTLLTALMSMPIFASVKIGDLYYELDDTELTASVTYQYYDDWLNYDGLDAVGVPETVTYDSKTYSVTSIGVAAFAGCRGLTSVTIGNYVTEIGESAFEGCSGLTGDLIIPNSVTSIGNSAFYDCSGLTSVVIDNSVTSIGNSAFRSCSGLTSVVIGNSVTSIGVLAFYDCSGLIKSAYPDNFSNPFSDGVAISYPKDGSFIEDGIIWGKDKEAIYFVPLNFTGVLTIPNSVTLIGSSAFQGCSGLTSVVIGNSVTSIGSSAFQGCSGLTSVIIPNSVTSIGNSAFEGCSELTALYIGEKVKSIGSKAFASSQLLEEIGCASVVPPTGDKDIFSDFTYTYATLFVPEKSMNSYKSLDPWNNFFTYKDLSESGVEEVGIDASETLCDVFNLNGQLVKRQASQSDIDALSPGIYIIGGKKVIVK